MVGILALVSNPAAHGSGKSTGFSRTIHLQIYGFFDGDGGTIPECNSVQEIDVYKRQVVEYANKQEDTQAVLKPIVLSFLMQVARQYTAAKKEMVPDRLSDKIVHYMGEHSDTVTLKDIAKRFSYHPNYISTLLHREIGKSFSEILLEQRMERAVILLRGTNLPIEEIALMLGYSNSSNFYKTFRAYYNQSPRNYVAAIQ